MSGRNVLIVEDEYFLADDMANLVREMGGNVIGPYSNTKDIKCRMQDIDLALLDVKMDDGNTVYPFAWRLRLANVPFAFITGYSKDAIQEDFRDTPMIRKDDFNEVTLAQIMALLFPFRPEVPSLSHIGL